MLGFQASGLKPHFSLFLRRVQWFCYGKDNIALKDDLLWISLTLYWIICNKYYRINSSRRCCLNRNNILLFWAHQFFHFSPEFHPDYSSFAKVIVKIFVVGILNVQPILFLITLCKCGKVIYCIYCNTDIRHIRKYLDFTLTLFSIINLD